MERQELLIRIDELEKQILELPAGSIAKKKVRGKDYYYHRWFEGKKRVEKYLPLEAVDELQRKIEQRKVLESKLKTKSGHTSRAELCNQYPHRPVATSVLRIGTKI